MIRNNALVFIVVAASIALAGCSAGHNAVMNGDASQLQQILSKPNAGNENVNSLLYDSGVSGCLSCAQALIGAGAKPDAEMLMIAAMLGHEQVARLMVNHGAEVGSARVLLEKKAPSQKTLQMGRDVLEAIAAPRTEASTTLASNHPDPVVDAAPIHPQLVPHFHEAENPDDYALIVGVEKYTDLPAATYAEADAESAREFVRALGVPDRNIATLTGVRATRSGLAKQLEGWLANNVNENSTVYFYYSGHGAPDPKNGDAYLVPIDGDPQYLDQTAYPLKRLYDRLNALKAKRVVVMLDSCFSGAGGRSVLARGARPLVSKVNIGTVSAQGKISVLAAAGGDQISGTSDDNGHGLFTYYLLEGLNGAARNSAGDVTLGSLYGYLRPKVMDDAKRANREQIPQFLCDDGSSGTILRRK